MSIYTRWEKIKCQRCGTIDGAVIVNGKPWHCHDTWHYVGPSEYLVKVRRYPEMFVYCWARSTEEALAFARQPKHRLCSGTLEAISAAGAPLDHDTGFIDDCRYQPDIVIEVQS